MKILAGSLALVAAVTGLILFFVFRHEGAVSRRLSAEAEPIGLVATPATWYDSGEEGDVQGHTLTFSFVDGDNGVHAETMEQITWYDAARGYKVCYNPADAEDFRLYASDHSCGR